MYLKRKDTSLERNGGLRFKKFRTEIILSDQLMGRAYNLYKVAREFAGLARQRTVYDSITNGDNRQLRITRLAVIGIEYVPGSYRRRKVNTKSMISKECIVLYTGDMKDILTHDFINPIA